jgi:hypothetical protein
VRPCALAVLLALASPLASPGGDVPGAALVLETAPGTPGSDSAGAPPRFVLLKDGQVFVGGTARVEAGRLDRREASALLRRADAARRLPGLSSPVALGGDETRAMRLRLLDGRPAEIEARGDPSAAPPALLPLASLLADLLAFHHPSLRPYAPVGYAMAAREARLPGGCRPWVFPFPVEEALTRPRLVPAADASGWPTGAVPASVCSGDRRYAVTLRPLLPGELP